MLFKNREDAAKKLILKLIKYKNDPNTLVLGLPRGGVVLASIIAHELGLPLDILVVRKLGVPSEPELAFGAISEDGQTFFNNDIITLMHLSDATIHDVIVQEKKEAARRATVYRKGKDRASLQGKKVILVDDGVATGATMLAAIASARAQGAQKVIVAIPVAPSDTYQKIKESVDECICLDMPVYFPGVGAFYEQFNQLSDEDVLKLLSS